MRLTALQSVTCALGLVVTLLGPFFPLPVAHSRSLKDLIKRPPEVYLPSQIVPGRIATFTIRGKAGEHVQLLISPFNKGKQALASGQDLRVGEAFVKETAVIPDSGMLDLEVQIPTQHYVYREKQYVEVIVWDEVPASTGDIAPVDGQDTAAETVKTNIRLAQMMNESGPTDDNSVWVGEPADDGQTLIIPGGGEYTDVIRGLDQYNYVRGNERKKQLVDDGQINRDRDADKQLVVPGQ